MGLFAISAKKYQSDADYQSWHVIKNMYFFYTKV